MKRDIPIIRTTQLSDGNILQTIVGATKPGSQKLQFPYEIPALELEFTPEANRTLLLTAGILAAGAVGAVLIHKLT